MTAFTVSNRLQEAQTWSIIHFASRKDEADENLITFIPGKYAPAELNKPLWIIDIASSNVEYRSCET